MQLVDRQDRDMRIRSTFPITEVALRSYALTQFLCGGILLFKFKNTKDCEETSWYKIKDILVNLVVALYRNRFKFY